MSRFAMLNQLLETGKFEVYKGEKWSIEVVKANDTVVEIKVSDGWVAYWGSYYEEDTLRGNTYWDFPERFPMYIREKCNTQKVKWLVQEGKKRLREGRY